MLKINDERYMKDTNSESSIICIAGKNGMITLPKQYANKKVRVTYHNDETITIKVENSSHETQAI